MRGRKAFPRWAKTRVHGCATTEGVEICARFWHLLSRRQTLASGMRGQRSPLVRSKGTKTVGEDTRWLSRPPRSPSQPHSPHRDVNRLRITMRPGGAAAEVRRPPRSKLRARQAREPQERRLSAQRCESNRGKRASCKFTLEVASKCVPQRRRAANGIRGGGECAVKLQESRKVRANGQESGNFRGVIPAACRRSGLERNARGTGGWAFRKSARNRSRSSPLMSAVRTCISICAPLTDQRICWLLAIRLPTIELTAPSASVDATRSPVL